MIFITLNKISTSAVNKTLDHLATNLETDLHSFLFLKVSLITVPVDGWLEDIK